MNDLLFFHNSDSLIESFSLETEPMQKASYYWLNTHYHHYQPWNPRYFYLFLKKPKTDNIRFYIRQMGTTFDELVFDYEERSFQRQNTPRSDPTILITNDKIIPDLIADAGPVTSKNTRIWTILKPVEHKGKTIELLDENLTPINFNEIPLLNTIFPNLSQSIPFVLPAKYDEWNGITYEKLRAEEKIIKNNILESIDAEYILLFEGLSGARSKLDKITPELLERARKIVDDDFKYYIKSHLQEKQIKMACLQYYVAIYLLNLSKYGNRTRMKELITQHNQIGDLLYSLQNFDFYMGGCGIDAQNLCQK